MDVLGVLARLMFVKDVQDLADEFAAGVVADVLRDGDKMHPGLPQLPHIHFRMQRVAAESAQGVDDDELEGPVGTLGLVDHLLEDGPIVVERRRAGFGEDFDDIPTLAFAVGLALGDLIGERIGRAPPAGIVDTRT